MTHITEIIPEDMPDWMKEAMDDGQFFARVVERFEAMGNDSEKLLILSDTCSDLILGGERGWENMNFKEFVSLVRQSINKPPVIKEENTSNETFGQKVTLMLLCAVLTLGCVKFTFGLFEPHFVSVCDTSQVQEHLSET